MHYTKTKKRNKTVDTHTSASAKKLPTRVQEFLWKNHAHRLFEVHQHVNRTPPVTYFEALEGLRGGLGFWGVVPRVRVGNTKDDCVTEFDVLWVDIDRWEGVDPLTLLGEVKALLPEELHPSVVNFTGNKGLHCFWKLDRLLPIAEIEEWNRVLAHVVGGDRNCYDATRILAHPGVPHRSTGGLVETIEFSAEIHPVQRLDLLPQSEEEAPRKKPKGRIRPFRAEEEEWFKAADELTCWGQPPELDLVNWLLGIDKMYLSTYKPRGWAWRKKTRSEIEMHIVYVLVGKGASDDQVIALADGNFSKHDDEPNYRYIEVTIRSAREHWYRNGWLTHPSGGLRKKTGAGHRWGTVEDFDLYLGLVRGQRLSEWVAEVESAGRSRASAYRDKKELLRIGLVEVRERRIHRVDGQQDEVADHVEMDDLSDNG